jgi:Tetracyclin repressor-like, C-terminal domain
MQLAMTKPQPRSAAGAALVDGMIAVHSRYPAAHRVLLEESPHGDDSRGAHDLFEKECRKGYEAVFKANSPAAADTRIASQVLAGAVAGAVHEAARQGTLGSPVLRREFIILAES